MKRKITFLIAAFFALTLIIQSFTAQGQVVSGTEYQTTNNSFPSNWSTTGTQLSSYTKLLSAQYIQTDDFIQNGFTSIKISARTFGGTDATKNEITVSWYNTETKTETVLCSITPTTNKESAVYEVTSSDITNPTGNTEGYIKFCPKSSTSSIGAGIAKVTIKYKSCNPSISTLAFGDVEVGDNEEKTFTLTTTELTSNLTLSTGVGSIYSVSPTSINKSATSTTVTVTCTPTEEGASNGTLTISGGGLSANVTVALTATGVPASSDPTCSVEPDIYDFGSVAVNGTKSHTFTVTTANLTEDLALSMSSNKYTVEPNEIDKDDTSTEVTITFAPTATGNVDANLLINGSGFDDEIVAVLSGTGVTPYDVTLNPGSGSVSQTPWNITMNNGNLPAASPSDACASNGWTFYGWSTTEVSETNEAPNIVPTAYVPSTSGITLYAVYKEGQSAFDNTASGNWTIYATVTTSKTTTNYYATSISSNKLQSSTTSSDATEFSFVKKDGTGNYVIKMGSKYLCHSGSDDTNVDVQDDEYVWTISGGTNGIWHVAAASYSRALIFRASTYNVFGGYKNVNNTEYFDVKIGVKSPITYNSYPECLEKLDTPTFTVDAGEYDDIQTVAIEYVDGATVYYTTDGTTPSAQNGTEYTSALTIDGTTTVKAIAVKAGYDDSDVAEATYTITTLYTMQAIYNKALAIGGTASNVKVKFNNWVVSGVGTDTKTVYVTDNAGKGFIIYTSNHGFAVNDILSGTVNSTPLKIYAGAAEFTNLTASTDGLTVTHNGSITTLSKTISELGGVNTGAAVTISNLSYNGTNLSDGVNNISPYNMLCTSSLFTSGHDYSSVTGVYVHYNSTKQIAPRSAADVVEVEYDITLTQPQAGGTIGTQGNITTAKFGQEVTLTSTPADHYRFVLWTVMNGETPVAVNNNKFTMPKAPVTVTATFVQLYGITIDDDIENGTVSVVGDVTEAAENDNITLTITPEDGYALKTLTVYKTGDPETEIAVSNNAFTMPAYAVTVTAEFGAEYTVTYYRNAVNDDDTAELTYGEGADVTILAYDDNDVDFEAPEGKKFVKWTANADGTGTEYQPDDVIDGLAANYDLYAQWRDIVYHVSFSVNGEIVDTKNVNYNTAIGTLPTDPELAPLTFLGWSSTSATGATNVTASWKPTGTNEDVTVYAVFGNMSTDYFTLTGTTTNIPTGYASYTWEIDDEDYFQTYNVMQGQYSTNKFIQYKSNGGYLYNIKDFGKIKSIVVTYYTGGGNNSSREIAIRINDEKFSGASGGTVMSVDYSGDVYTFTYDDEHYDYHYFSIYNSSTTSTIASIRINYEAAAPLTVNIIDDNTNMTTDIEATTCVVVESGVTLTFTGENKGTAENLIIEDGGQLITNSSIPLTYKKQITSAAKDGGWYTISTPVHTASNTFLTPGSVENLILDPATNYDFFYYDEASHTWMNYKQSAFNLNIGQGYLYRNNGAELHFAGYSNQATYYEKALSYASTEDKLKGFNLIGNPYPQNITMSDVTVNNEGALSGGYVLSESGAWSADVAATIAPTQGFLVQIDKTGVTARITKPAGGAKSRSDRDYLKFIVANSQYEDAAFALFEEGYGLNKIDHRNSDIPMLYIPKDRDIFAIATMDNSTQSFNLNFKAKTTGKYTLSYEATGEYSYLHVIDRLTGEDVDMLLEGEYSFIASPSDNENRFIVNMRHSNNAENSENSIFAYQNGNDIVVNGEGELQIFDVMGRMVGSQRINGVQTINIPLRGVYIFRLNEKTQKIVVE